MNIVEAIERRDLLGGLPIFRGGLEPWRGWLVIWKAVWGIPLSAWERERFCAWTGRSSYSPPPGGWGSVVLCVGRRAGKTTAVGVLSAFAALAAGDSARGQWIAAVSQDFRAGQRNLFRAVAGAFEDVPAIARTVAKQTADTITLKSGLSIGVWPYKPSALRGLGCRLVAIDEIAHAASPDGRPLDRELIVAARPTLATIPGSKLVVLSSPASASGALFDLVKAHHGRDDSHVLCVVAPAYELNPTLPADYLAEMKADPEVYASEVLGQFRQGASALFDAAALDACVVSGRREIPPAACGAVRAAFDPSGGRHDRAALAIGFRDKVSGRVIVAALRAWNAPHSPAVVAREAVAVAREYGCKAIHLDRYAGDTIAGLIRAEGLAAELFGQSASDLLMDCLPVVQSGSIEFPDPSLSDTAAELLSELRSVERRPGGAGRDRAEIPRGSGRVGHGDLACALAGLVSTLPAGRPRLKMAAPVIVGRRPALGIFGERLRPMRIGSLDENAA